MIEGLLSLMRRKYDKISCKDALIWDIVKINNALYVFTYYNDIIYRYEAIFEILDKNMTPGGQNG